MRICYFADIRAVHTERWIRYFAEKGHKMSLISYMPPNEKDVANLEKFGVRYLTATGNLHLKKFWLSLQDLKNVRSSLKDEKVDILHCHFLGMNSWYSALSQFHPLIITVMGGDVLGANWKPRLNIQDRYLTPYALKKADLVTTWSPLLSKTVKPYVSPSTPIKVVHGGVHLEKFFPAPKPPRLLEQLNIPADAQVVFSARLMRRLYNIEQIAQAANEVAQKLPNTYFVFAIPKTIKDAEYSEEVLAIIKNGAANANTRYVETIPYDEIPDYFRLADVTVSIPSHDGTPMTVMESMACATPTVMGDLADYDATYFEHEKTTLMADVKNPQAIAAAILRLLKDRELAEKIASEARRRVEADGSYESQMSKMERLYESLMPGKVKQRLKSEAV